ncbi:MAG: shikimate dehydrogenase family protein [Bacteroidales bacterium]
MKKYGLIGYPLEHSFSEKYFTDKFKKESISDASYKNYPLRNINELIPLIKSEKDLCGLNITIPYKKDVIPFLNFVENDAIKAGAVNVMKIIRNNDRIILKGYNTDIYGFRESLKPVMDRKIIQAIILGTGGSSGAVDFVLSGMGIKTLLVSRLPKHGCITYENITENIILSSQLIVNTTPLGMYPSTDKKPDIPYHLLTSQHILYDLIYNPEQTLFLKEGIKRKCRVFNGLTMLKLQAEKSWQIWNDPSV